jgi:hypothetical protein
VGRALVTGADASSGISSSFTVYDHDDDEHAQQPVD